MRRIARASILTVVASSGLVPGAPSVAQPNTSVQKQVTPAAARSIAKDAYLFTYPLVMNYRTMYAQAIQGDGAFGKWLHLGLASPADTDIVTPNNDTPYSYAWVDLRAEPWVLTLPKIEKERFYTSQWDDLWGYVLDNPGSVFDGNEGVSVLLASPKWQGELPEGVARIVRGESDFLGTLTRTQVFGGADDLGRVKEIQQSYELRPLSAFLGAQAPAAAPAIDWPAWTEHDETTPAYWSYVPLLLQFVTPHRDDRATHHRMASIGIKPGVRWEPEKLDPAIRAAIEQGQQDALAEMKQLSESIPDATKLFGPRQRIGTDYVNRALGVYTGIFGNVAEVSYYISLGDDAQGQPLDGARASYTLTFPAGQLPPTKCFWSVTMYSLPQRLLVENPLERYSIGSSTPGLKQSDDGSLTLYFSAESPGEERASNWLPAPKGPFWMVLRCYGPANFIVDGRWTCPEPVAAE